MKKSSQTNRSALLMAGQKSLYSIQQQGRNYYTMNQPKSNKQQRPNQMLYESNVRQVYKRSGYHNYQAQQQYGYNQNKSLMSAQYRSPKQPAFQQKHSPLSYQTMNRYENNYNTKPVQHSLQIDTYKNQQKSNNIYNKQQLNKNLSITNKRRPYMMLYKVDNDRIKKIMMKLTHTKLRKMQALVRGFLVRRKVYPKFLEEYLIAKSVLSLIQANVVYRQISTIIMQTITFPKYDDQQQFAQLYKGRQNMLQEMVYESILTRVIQQQMKPIIEDSLTKRALLVNRPQITFGFNLRDPLQLLLYEKLLQLMAVQLRKVCQQSIKDQALERRQLFIIDQWIEKYNLLQPLFKQIANQLLQENIGEYIVEDILQKVIRQAAFVVAQSGYNNQVNQWYIKTIQNVKGHLQEAVLQEAFAQALIQMGYGIDKLPSKGSLL